MKRLIYLLSAVCVAACTEAPTTMNVMTFNMRYDNPEDGENNWQFRRDRVTQVIISSQVDVFGTQELLVNQFNELKERLPQFEAVGVGRIDGKDAGEFNAVFFLRDRFTLVDSGSFWLSETPEVVGSMGWDGACERLATWTVLRDTKGEELFFINTHLDHVGEVARREGVSLLLDRIASLRGDRRVVLTGDFNADPESDVIAHVAESGVMRDAKVIAAEKAGAAWSFSGFGRVPEAERLLIDYIFVSDGVAVDRYEVLPDTLGGGYVSDHAPVKAVIRFVK